MKILIVDRDRLASQLLQNRLEAEGHEVVVEPVRKTAFELVDQQHFEIVAFDPAPLPSARQVTLPLRWEQREDYLYLIQLGHDINHEDMVRCGLNDAIAKPFDWQEVQEKIANAKRLTEFMHRLSHTPEVRSINEFVFGKRAFCKLVLSALDRANRYGEQGYLLSIRMDNLDRIAQAIGEEKALQMFGNTEKYLSKLHRLSDFLGHTETAEYTLLLLRPAVDTEPQDALERFSIALREFQVQYQGAEQPHFTIELWELPSARIISQNRLVG